MLRESEPSRILRRSGRSMTKQRQAIFDALQGTTSHPTALELFDMVRQQIPNITLATVYRNLGVLQELGLARELNGGSGAARYDAITQYHAHVRCLDCGRTDDIGCDESPDTETRAQEVTDYLITGHCLAFEGVCPACRPQSTH